MTAQGYGARPAPAPSPARVSEPPSPSRAPRRTRRPPRGRAGPPCSESRMPPWARCAPAPEVVVGEMTSGSGSSSISGTGFGTTSGLGASGRGAPAGSAGDGRQRSSVTVVRDASRLPATAAQPRAPASGHTPRAALGDSGGHERACRWGARTTGHRRVHARPGEVPTLSLTVMCVSSVGTMGPCPTATRQTVGNDARCLRPCTNAQRTSRRGSTRRSSCTHCLQSRHD